jgi:ABC-type antimicrobial peptide transport system ATPase subunit
LRLQGYIRFKPELYDPSLSPSSQLQASPMKQKIKQTTSSRLPFWPDHDNECVQSLVPSGKAQIGLGISWSLRPDCIRTNANGVFTAAY